MAKREKREYIPVRLPPQMAANVQRIADRRTSGNRSEAIRYLLAQALAAEERGDLPWMLGEAGYEYE